MRRAAIQTPELLILALSRFSHRPAQKIISTAISIYRYWMEGTHCHGIFRSDLHFFETLPLLLKDVMHIFTSIDYDEDFYAERVGLIASWFGVHDTRTRSSHNPQLELCRQVMALVRVVILKTMKRKGLQIREQAETRRSRINTQMLSALAIAQVEELAVLPKSTPGSRKRTRIAVRRCWQVLLRQLVDVVCFYSGTEQGRKEYRVELQEPLLRFLFESWAQSGEWT